MATKEEMAEYLQELNGELQQIFPRANITTTVFYKTADNELVTGDDPKAKNFSSATFTFEGVKGLDPKALNPALYTELLMDSKSRDALPRFDLDQNGNLRLRHDNLISENGINEDGLGAIKESKNVIPIINNKIARPYTVTTPALNEDDLQKAFTVIRDMESVSGRKLDYTVTSNKEIVFGDVSSLEAILITKVMERIDVSPEKQYVQSVYDALKRLYPEDVVQSNDRSKSMNTLVSQEQNIIPAQPAPTVEAAPSAPAAPAPTTYAGGLYQLSKDLGDKYQPVSVSSLDDFYVGEKALPPELLAALEKRVMLSQYAMSRQDEATISTKKADTFDQNIIDGNNDGKRELNSIAKKVLNGWDLELMVTNRSITYLEYIFNKAEDLGNAGAIEKVLVDVEAMRHDEVQKRSLPSYGLPDGMNNKEIAEAVVKAHKNNNNLDAKEAAFAVMLALQNKAIQESKTNNEIKTKLDEFLKELAAKSPATPAPAVEVAPLAPAAANAQPEAAAPSPTLAPQDPTKVDAAPAEPKIAESVLETPKAGGFLDTLQKSATYGVTAKALSGLFRANSEKPAPAQESSAVESTKDKTADALKEMHKTLMALEGSLDDKGKIEAFQTAYRKARDLVDGDDNKLSAEEGKEFERRYNKVNGTKEIPNPSAKAREVFTALSQHGAEKTNKSHDSYVSELQDALKAGKFDEFRNVVAKYKVTLDTDGNKELDEIDAKILEKAVNDPAKFQVLKDSINQALKLEPAVTVDSPTPAVNTPAPPPQPQQNIRVSF